MSFRPNQNRVMSAFMAVSFITHLLVLFPLGKLGRFDFAKPVEPIAAYLVDLQAPERETAAGKEAGGAGTADASASAARHEGAPISEREEAEIPPPMHGGAASIPAAAPALEPPLKKAEIPSAAEPAAANVPEDGNDDQAEETDAVAAAPVPVEKKEEAKPKSPVPVAQASAKPRPVPVSAPPLRKVEEFVATRQETLNYRISMYGIPVGTAEMEAKRDQGDLRLTLKMKSSPALSGIYPVDDFVETHHIGGNFIVTKIKQQEGSFKSDRGFTLFLREKTVFWRNNLKNTSLTETVPNNQVLDVLSSVYLLRKRALKVGTTEQLQVYDSDAYSVMPVEVLRKERITLPGFRETDALVVKPLLKSGGIFKRTDDLLIWLTDDENRVPVKVETRIALGKVTVELVSAQSKRDEFPSAAPTPK